jgi:hypothetical protein
MADAQRFKKSVDEFERDVRAAKYSPPHEGVDPAHHFDPLVRIEQTESRLLQEAENLEAAHRPARNIPAGRPAMDTETVLADGTGGYTRTGKSFHGRSIYRDADGKLYYVDNLHEGAASEIEVFSPTGQHLGTMSPGGTFDASTRVKGRMLPKNKL